MAKALGLSIGRIRHARIRARLSGAAEAPISEGSDALIRFDLARTALAELRTALAECRRVDEVLAIKDNAERLKLYARQARDRELIADAAEIQLRATRQLGMFMISAAEAGQIAKGRPKQNGSAGNPFPQAAMGPAILRRGRVTLAEAGIDKKLADKARKAGAMPERTFEAAVEDLRSRTIAGRALIIEAEPAPINGARAVMGSRQEPDNSLDYFPTPPWATRALVEKVCAHLDMKPPWRRPAWDPACGEGHMSDVLAEYGPAIGTDIFDYGANGLRRAETWSRAIDFLTEFEPPEVDWIITNSPFGDRALAFALRAFDISRFGVASFVQSRWMKVVDRYEKLFNNRPPTLISYFAERVPLCKACWNPDGDTATAYCWLVWVKDRAPLPPFWIPPGCREALTKPTDRARFAAWSLPPDGRVEHAA